MDSWRDSWRGSRWIVGGVYKPKFNCIQVYFSSQINQHELVIITAIQTQVSI